MLCIQTQGTGLIVHVECKLCYDCYMNEALLGAYGLILADYTLKGHFLGHLGKIRPTHQLNLVKHFWKWKKKESTFFRFHIPGIKPQNSCKKGQKCKKKTQILKIYMQERSKIIFQRKAEMERKNDTQKGVYIFTKFSKK